MAQQTVKRGMWGWVINEQLQPMGYDAAAYLLGWSLQNNPSDIHLGPSHFISKKIAASSEYQALSYDIECRSARSALIAHKNAHPKQTRQTIRCI